MSASLRSGRSRSVAAWIAGLRGCLGGEGDSGGGLGDDGGGEEGGGDGDGGGGDGDGEGGGGESEMEARSTGSHCGGHATGCSSARWSKNGTASLRSTMVAAQSASGAPCSTQSQIILR